MFARVQQYNTVYAWLAVGVVALVDYLTGYELGFFVFYFIPVGLGTLRGGRRVGYVLAVSCAVVWLVIDITSAHPYSSPWYRYWNALIRYAAFCMVAGLLSHMRDLLKQEQDLTAHLTRTLQEVRELQGLLPICSTCKKIRDDHGYWEHMENYIATHSKAEFTHSMCPECLQRFYPDFFPTPPSPGPRGAADPERGDAQ